MLDLIISTKAYDKLFNGGFVTIKPMLSKSAFETLKKSSKEDSEVFVFTLKNPNKIKVYWTVISPTNPDFSSPLQSSQFFEVGLRRCW